MGDPRNVAHAKKVTQEKHHKGDAAHSQQPGKKAQQTKKNRAAAAESSSIKSAEPTTPEQKPDPTQLEKSLAVIAKLRELEFHSRANIEKLAELSLTIEDELKQKAFVESIGDVYSAQEAFHSKISALIEAYQAECDRLRPAG
jgi:hypothetical protein